MVRRVQQHTQPFSLFSFQDIITSVTGVIVLVTLLLTLELMQKAELSTIGNTGVFSEQVRRVLVDTQNQITKMRELFEQQQQATREMAAVSPTMLRRQRHDLNTQSQQLGAELERLRAQAIAVDEQLTAWKVRHSNRETDRQELGKLDQQVESLESEISHLRKSRRVIFNPAQDMDKRAWLVDIQPEMLHVAQAGKNSVPLHFGDGQRQGGNSDFIQWAGTRDKSSEYFVLLVRPQGVERYSEVRLALEELGFQIGFEVVGEAVVAIDPQHGAAY